MIKIDTTPPNITNMKMNFVNGDWEVYDGSWTKRNLFAGRVKGSPGPTGAIDERSGNVIYQISSTGRANDWVDFKYDNSKSLYKMSSTGTHRRYFRAVDGVGNASGAITVTAYIDQEPPTCGNVTNQSISWATSRTLYQQCTDTGGSGCVYSSYSKQYSIKSKRKTKS